MKLHCEVLVVGAGVAGVPAAVAAARAGANTVLVEKAAFPGGTGVANLHRYICGLYPNGPAASHALLNGGLTREICERLRELDSFCLPIRMGRVDVLPYDTKKLKQVFTALIEGEERLRVLYETQAERCVFDAGVICRVAANGVDIVPGAVVDCSGDGVIIRSDESLHEPAPETGRCLAGFTIHLTALAGADDALPIKVPYAIRQGIEEGVLPAYLRFTTFVPGVLPCEGWCKLSLPSGHPDLHRAHADAEEVLDHLKESIPAFATARILATSTEVSEREGPRLKGLYTLTEQDIVAGRKFPDAIARGSWPIELWDAEEGPTFRYFRPGEVYDIPLRCLQSAAVENLLCAGRCISVTREALGSTRVMGTCMALGEAAGLEAARIGMFAIR
jgi:hypothetical protein